MSNILSFARLGSLEQITGLGFLFLPDFAPEQIYGGEEPGCVENQEAFRFLSKWTLSLEFKTVCKIFERMSKQKLREIETQLGMPFVSAAHNGSSPFGGDPSSVTMFLLNSESQNQ